MLWLTHSRIVQVSCRTPARVDIISGRRRCNATIVWSSTVLNVTLTFPQRQCHQKSLNPLQKWRKILCCFGKYFIIRLTGFWKCASLDSFYELICCGFIVIRVFVRVCVFVCVACANPVSCESFLIKRLSKLSTHLSTDSCCVTHTHKHTLTPTAHSQNKLLIGSTFPRRDASLSTSPSTIKNT